MGDQLARAEDFENKAEKKLSGWGLFGSKYEDASDLFDKSANSYKLAKSWDKAGSTYMKLANCNLKLESKHEAAQAYVDAAHCYKKTKINEAVSCLDHAVNIFCEIGRISMAARYLKEIAELYESEQNIEQAVVYYEKSADFYESEEVSTSANQCKQKVAQFSAQLEQDVIAITNALERYQELDPTFSGTREHRLLADIAAAIDEEDVAKFTEVIKEFDSMTPLDSWKTTLLLRVKEKLKAKELEEDDLT
ncbi:Tetratricopeptide-like helical domain superfamily [Sesbania bispinosa]|nr:Tetratricopeptide-like helical domain superfamily [Sesbania bispinosa]